MSLRTRIIRLAHINPELRPHLLPLLKEARMPESYADYSRDLEKYIQALDKAVFIMEEIVDDLDGETSLKGPLLKLYQARDAYTQWLRAAVRGKVAGKNYIYRALLSANGNIGTAIGGLDYLLYGDGATDMDGNPVYTDAEVRKMTQAHKDLEASHKLMIKALNIIRGTRLRVS